MKLRLVQDVGSSQECPPDGLQVEINSLVGRLCTLRVGCRSVIKDVKHKIEDVAGIPWFEQRLIIPDGELEDNANLPPSQEGLLQLTLLRRDPEQAQWLQRFSGPLSWSASLKSAPANLQNDREVVIAAIRQQASNFMYASNELRTDREIGMLVVSGWGGELFQYLGEELRADRELFLTALKHRSPHGALRHAADELRSDKSMVLRAVTKSVSFLHEAPSHLQADRDVILAALRQPLCWQLSAFPGCDGIPHPPHLCHDKDFLLEAVHLGHASFLCMAFQVNPALGSDEAFMSKVCFALHDDCSEEDMTFPKELMAAMKDLHLQTNAQWAELHMRKTRLEAARSRSKLWDCKRRAQSAAETKRQGDKKNRHKRGGRHKVREVHNLDYDYCS